MARRGRHIAAACAVTSPFTSRPPIYPGPRAAARHARRAEQRAPPSPPRSTTYLRSFTSRIPAPARRRVTTLTAAVTAATAPRCGASRPGHSALAPPLSPDGPALTTPLLGPAHVPLLGPAHVPLRAAGLGGLGACEGEARVTAPCGVV